MGKKSAVKKQAKKEELEDEELEGADMSGGEDAGGEDAGDEPTLDDIGGEEDAPGKSPAALAREAEAKREAARSQQPPVKASWYEWKVEATLNPKKGRKLLRMQRTRNGATSEYVGHEKKIPKSFLNKIRLSGELKDGVAGIPKAKKE